MPSNLGYPLDELQNTHTHTNTHTIALNLNPKPSQRVDRSQPALDESQALRHCTFVRYCTFIRFASPRALRRFSAESSASHRRGYTRGLSGRAAYISPRASRRFSAESSSSHCRGCAGGRRYIYRVLPKPAPRQDKQADVNRRHNRPQDIRPLRALCLTACACVCERE